MRIRVQRTVNVVPEYQNKFLELAQTGIQRFRDGTGIEPDLFVNLRPKGRPVEVRIFTDFESMAQYEDIFLHKILQQDDSYLDSAEAAVDMIYEEPQDELYVRLDVDDHFMNRKGGRVATSGLDLSRSAPMNKKVAIYRTEREYCASKGRLRDVMRLNFEFIQNLHGATGHAADYFCTRFHAGSIGCSKLYFDSDDCPVCGPAFLQQDQEMATNPGLLQRPPITTMLQRILPNTLAFDVRARAQAPAVAASP
jgi:hypothetical protein